LLGQFDAVSRLSMFAFGWLIDLVRRFDRCCHAGRTARSLILPIQASRDVYHGDGFMIAGVRFNLGNACLLPIPQIRLLSNGFDHQESYKKFPPPKDLTALMADSEVREFSGLI